MFSPLHTYLNNHLAGSVLAIELMEHAIDRDRKLALISPYAELLPEIQSDQAVLRDLIERLDAGESKAKKAAAWLGEKISRVHRDTSDDPEKLGLLRMEEAEVLGLGILGKRALWLALKTQSGSTGPLHGMQCDRLIARAEEQFDLVERFRQGLAKSFLSG
jgi:hypothetical protein